MGKGYELVDGDEGIINGVQSMDHFEFDYDWIDLTLEEILKTIDVTTLPYFTVASCATRWVEANGDSMSNGIDIICPEPQPLIWFGLVRRRSIGYQHSMVASSIALNTLLVTERFFLQIIRISASKHPWLLSIY